MKENSIKRKTIDYEGEQIFLNICRYENNGRLAIIATTEDEYYCDITINLPEEKLDTDMLVAIDNNCKDIGLEKKLIEEKIIDGLALVCQYNRGIYDVVWLNLENLYEYDPKGFMKELSDKMVIVDDKEEMIEEDWDEEEWEE